MFSFQVTLSQLRCRRPQLSLHSEQTVILRFGSIKFCIKMTLYSQGLIGGKKITLALSSQQIQFLFANFALGMFMQNQNGRFFSLSSLQRLQIEENCILSQEIYFYNEQQQPIYSSIFSLNIVSFKDPKIPTNKQKIQNYKTFQQYFKKPSIPEQNINSKTLSSFLYGNKRNVVKNNTNSVEAPVKSISKKKSSKKDTGHRKALATTTQGWKKIKNNNSNSNLIQTEQINNNVVYQVQQIEDNWNPPTMEFTNTQQNTKQKIELLSTKIAQLNSTAPEIVKFQTASSYKTFSNNFKHTKQQNSHQILGKTPFQKLEANRKDTTKTKLQVNDSGTIIIDRQTLKNKAKQELQNYKGNNSVKIPLIRKGKYQLIDLTNLSEEQIYIYVNQTKKAELEAKQKKIIQKRLQQQEKQNKALKKQLEIKEKLMIKKQQEAKKKQLQQLLQNKKCINNKDSSKLNRISSFPISQQGENDQYQNCCSSDNDEQNYYQSDFQEMSLANSQKKSKIETYSNKKEEQYQRTYKKADESQSYNDSYDPDFESYSQSLASNKKLSLSQISESLRSMSPKKY